MLSQESTEGPVQGFSTGSQRGLMELKIGCASQHLSFFRFHVILQTTHFFMDEGIPTKD